MQGRVDDLMEQLDGFEADLERINSTTKKKKGPEVCMQLHCKHYTKAIVMHCHACSYMHGYTLQI